MVHHLDKSLRCGACAFILALSVTPSAIAKSRLPEYLRKPDTWFAGAEAKTIAANILTYQADLGGWPKNTDTTSAPYTGNRKQLKGTFDNDATTDELRFLARIFTVTKDTRYRPAIDKGIDHILQAQYPTGGWPQLYPPGKNYHRHITFNDDAMVRLMEFLREVYQSKTFQFVAADKKAAARQAFDRGIVCILKCQIKVDGQLTAWCAQHDEKDLSPRPGRSYELVSLSGAESVKVVLLLMSLDHPRPDVGAAIEGAVAWFESAKLTGIRVEVRPDSKSPKGTDKVVVKDPAGAAAMGTLLRNRHQSAHFLGSRRHRETQPRRPGLRTPQRLRLAGIVAA